MKGVQVETVAAAKKAAKRDGIFLGAWVDRTLRIAATDRLKATPVPAVPADDVMSVLADLSSKVDALSKRGFFRRLFS